MQFTTPLVAMRPVTTQQESSYDFIPETFLYFLLTFFSVLSVTLNLRFMVNNKLNDNFLGVNISLDDHKILSHRAKKLWQILLPDEGGREEGWWSGWRGKKQTKSQKGRKGKRKRIAKEIRERNEVG